MNAHPVFAILGMAGAWEWVIILVIVVIFFGVGKLPNVLGQMGKGVKAFKDGMKDDEEKKAIDVTPESPEATKVPEADEIRR
jgi:sec-independent protein translocase protein TatA